jgi:hypothetical protein
MPSGATGGLLGIILQRARRRPVRRWRQSGTKKDAAEAMPRASRWMDILNSC